MQTLSTQVRYREFRDTQCTWPMDARAAMFVLEASGSTEQYFERRDLDRSVCHVEATACTAGDPAQLAQFILYVRDLDPLHLGFVVQSPLPVGLRVQVNFTVDDRSIEVTGTIGRCRHFMEGWYEGVVHFDQEVHDA